MADTAQTEEDRKKGSWGLGDLFYYGILGGLAVAIGGYLLTIPGIRKWADEHLPAPFKAFINKAFAWFGQEPPFPQAEQQLSADIEQALKQKLGMDETLAKEIAQNKEHFFDVMQKAGATPEQLADMNNLKALLGDPKMLKALLTDDRTAALLVKMVPLGDAVQKELLTAFKDPTFDFSAIASALNASKPEEIKQNLSKAVLESMPKEIKSKMVESILKQFGITDPTAIAVFNENPIVIGKALVALGSDIGTIGSILGDTKSGKPLDIGSVLNLVEKHGAKLPGLLSEIKIPQNIDGALKAKIEGGLKFIGTKQNVDAVTEFVKNSGLKPEQVQEIFSVIQSQDPKAALQSNATLSSLVSTNIPKIGALLEKLDTSGLDSEMRDNLDLLATKKDGRYIGLEKFLGVKSASAAQIESSKVAAVVPEVKHTPVESGHAPDGYKEAAKLAFANTTGIALG